MKVIINTDFGGFGISEKAFELYKQRTGFESLPSHRCDEYYRDDPIMISVIEELAEEGNDRYSSLEVVEIPDDYGYAIDEYDGLETIILCIKEKRLRELIRLGNENDIVEYVKRTQYNYYHAEEDDEDEDQGNKSPALCLSVQR